MIKGKIDSIKITDGGTIIDGGFELEKNTLSKPPVSSEFVVWTEGSDSYFIITYHSKRRDKQIRKQLLKQMRNSKRWRSK